VRRAVDAGSPAGHFIIAGSSAPRGAVVHSGAGRIVPLRMRPLSMAERDVDTPTVSLAALLDGNSDIGGATSLRLTDYVEEITASGFPAIRGLPPRARRAELDAYLDNVVQREFPEQGYPIRRPTALRAWLAYYAAATSTTTAYSKSWMRRLPAWVTSRPRRPRSPVVTPCRRCGCSTRYPLAVVLIGQVAGPGRRGGCRRARRHTDRHPCRGGCRDRTASRRRRPGR